MMLNAIGVATWVVFVLHLTAFFMTAMVCHGELAKDRPSTKHLTEFYLCMSVGGVLGGMFNALLAPMVFVFLEEYVIAMVAACLLRPRTFFLNRLFKIQSKPRDETSPEWPEYILDIGYAVCLGLFAFALIRISASHNIWGEQDLTTYLAQRLYNPVVDDELLNMANKESAIFRARWIEMAIISLIPVAICWGFSGRPLRFGLGIVALLAANATFWLDLTNTVYRNRSFFGIQAVRRDPITKKENGEDVTYYYHTLIHGGIDHGRQYAWVRNPDGDLVPVDEKTRDQPITYFYPTGPIGQIFTELKAESLQRIEQEKRRQQRQGTGPGTPIKPAPFAVVGLGIGTLASYAVPGQHLTFYEIDPAVVRLSLPPEGKKTYFYYLQDAKKRGVDLDIVLGDGRLALRSAPPNYYQILVLDAFSSDAIPVHLMTSEALDLYLTKLADGGVLIFNITNRYVDLEPTLGDMAKGKNLIGLYQGDWYSTTNPDKFAADWVIMGKKRTDHAQMACEALSALALAPEGGLAGTLPWAGVYQAPLVEWPPLFRRLHPGKWSSAKCAERPLWTDDYSNLLRVMRW
jgi:spermidine synthase